MKRILVIFIILLSSCYQPNVDKVPTKFDIKRGNSPLEVVEIDGCQYLFGEWGNATVLTHKGNCINTIHPEHLRK